MPELPEVENVCRSLSKALPSALRLVGLEFFRKDLRFPIPQATMKKLLDSDLIKIERRGKYILFELTRGILVSHLGMTGQWRVTKGVPKEQKHDHVQLRFASDLTLTYNDPRRFGYLLFAEDQAAFLTLPEISRLGVEPLSDQFSALRLFNSAKGSRRAVKVFLMDQANVVGIGNIYASEVLYLAHIKPNKGAGRLKLDQWESLVAATKEILTEAIRTGGSTIRDYRNPEGYVGGYQQKHQVYNRAGKPCYACGTKVKSQVLGGRATYWCPKCQT
ncbi:MAG: hypothetical protein RJB66_96 [Pseudomonadota bacterium]|jgi:formamidopyrimidine-DNA glycosylase